MGASSGFLWLIRPIQPCVGLSGNPRNLKLYAAVRFQNGCGVASTPFK